MKKIALFFLFGMWLFCLFSCREHTRTLKETPISVYQPQYAKGFRILYFTDYKVIEVGSYRYYLSKNPKKANLKDSVVIQIPVKNMVCMAQSHWAAACILGQSETVSGMCDVKYIHDTLLQNQVKKGIIKDIAENQTINYEMLLPLQPQLLMLSFDNAQTRKMLANMGIPAVVNEDFLENHPLGRAEWLVFMAAFFEKDDEAKALFERSKQEYLKLCALTASVAQHPTIFDGSEISDVWYISGGKSYMARFYADGGSAYLWSENNDQSSLPLDFESVYYKGLTADFWRLYLEGTKTYSAIAQQNIRYKDFDAWKNQRIIFCDNLHSDLYGQGVYQPEVILADFIKIFHPDLLPNHQPKYYDLL